MSAWQPIETAPFDGCFLAIDRKWELRKCWRHKPSSRTDVILTWLRNGKFAATHWMPLPTPPDASASCAADGPESPGTTKNPSGTPQ